MEFRIASATKRIQKLERNINGLSDPNLDSLNDYKLDMTVFEQNCHMEEE